MSNVVLGKVAALIKAEKDLENIPALKDEILKEKKSIESQLRLETEGHLQKTVQGIQSLSVTVDSFKELKQDLQKIDELAKLSESAIDRYDIVQRATQLYETIQEVDEIYKKLNSFNSSLTEVNALCDEEIQRGIDIDSEVPNLLPIHFRLTELRDFSEKLTELSTNSQQDTKQTIRKLNTLLEPAIEKFDSIVREISLGITESLRERNFSLIIRLAKVLDYEEREDLKAQIFHEIVTKVDKRSEDDSDGKRHLTSSTNFVSTLDVIDSDTKGAELYQEQVGRLQQRKYKQLAFDAIEESIRDTFKNCKDTFVGDDRFEVLNNLDWVYQDLALIRETHAICFPSRWNMFHIFFQWYYKYLNQIIVELIESEPETIIILDILEFDKNYTNIMRQDFGFSKDKIVSIIGVENREKLLQDYLSLIIVKMNEWLFNIEKNEQEAFIKREEPPARDDQNHFSLPGAFIVFQMFQQQATVATGSGQGLILDGVIKHFCSLLSKRQNQWDKLLKSQLNSQIQQMSEDATDDELDDTSKIAPGLMEYIIALANDQISGSEKLETIETEFVALVSKKYQVSISTEIGRAIDDCADLAHDCLNHILALVFFDVSELVSKTFSKAWYPDGSSFLNETVAYFEEYVHEFIEEMKPDLLASFLPELLNKTILEYFACLGYKRKFKESKVFDCVKRDVQILYSFFSQYIEKEEVQAKFTVFEIFLHILELENEADILEVWKEYLQQFNDLSPRFLEGILACRKDFGSTQTKKIVAEVEMVNRIFEHEYSDSFEASFMGKFRLAEP
ncbi:Exocyst complex component [Komagataella phaffii CBS 7435]|uniref:Essential 88kDa subunit of the exocyst complex n=2 Tax=Komagataella phaffii TaxID=460519 RepID=C4QYI0_KOMPG|nr:Essential 88kDa subunit of the exocyst complex [Komagataella phaffii GS115]AOA61313.1 GQ67_01705T0 [Komagataella phaffii]CAH2447126.1 Exocyst complex component [Komagataella phaffii CBS 7435]AOA65794.1 GQ68_01720T0 [Komagataella phaffii GS115]CAY68303.1 Essential 88kDa subunit of the exocyst complex [Komagataella phaffii GS115]CCA37371.1 Exocyst complex component [Komagataella phaffii CBS 7435]